MTPSSILRPVHAWFFCWERIVPSLYRVVATGLGAIVMAVVLTAAGVHAMLAAGLAVAIWIGLAVGQEHDERVRLPPDGAFVAALAGAVSSKPLGLRVDVAEGPGRARREEWDTMAVLSAGGAPGHSLAGLFITVERHAADGWMRLDITGDDEERCGRLDARFGAGGGPAPAGRDRRTHAAGKDAAVIRAALTAWSAQR